METRPVSQAAPMLPSRAVQANAPIFHRQLLQGAHLVGKPKGDENKVSVSAKAPFQVTGSFAAMTTDAGSSKPAWAPGLQVEGRSPLLGMVIAAAFDRVGGPMLDRTPQAVAAIRQELALAESGWVDPATAVDAAETRRQLADDTRRVVLAFQTQGTVTTATLTGPDGEQSFTFDMAKAGSVAEVEAFVQMLAGQVGIACAQTADPAA